MIIGTGKIYLRASWAHSLKEKRMIVQSLTTKVRNKFNVSIVEIENQDIHQSIVLGIACVSNSTRHANSVIQNVIDYIENNTDAVSENVSIEIL
ncbi:hypothetical protein BD780_002810 [Clostridium tetanomorphum]|uniref:DUF503 domain-containing protein n=1 Tax=Clostridium tetanomorphum TaxID=1553 RepID=A0A923E942_CLOTT|nr:DUF503 domain-containing protein [Clostridium tetanomorphum]KAJ53840.1 hypothetical protein CTM_01185 [Clostridium tetanomorphum DSM 665]MBC2397354.1 DUF503 domain-containing protein [Clostridium tetanomorphum]MBP1862574.1 uncharacterized protein YlxP (DUF503 family) [Clostridium tetanomorphum]NRS85585.1 hypothetical protein [Clostridium tetanomorphum]NRZ96404.1 hypothetical protein [Clostridium tetanomorphum]